MFCPNCGRDCEDFKFCPSCGRDLQGLFEGNRQETTEEQNPKKKRQALENAGKLFCPKCLSENISVEDIDLPINDPVLYWTTYAHFAGYFGYRSAKKVYLAKQRRGPQNECLDCGYTWYPKLDALVKRYRPYLEELIGENDSVVYHGENGITLTLEWKRLVIDSPDTPKKVVLHPYEIMYWDLHSTRQKIHEVLVKDPEPRWLTICDKKHKKWPGPGTPELAATDPYTILYDKCQTAEFRKVRDALNGIIEENIKAGML